jgi:demethylmenaquinone methyltransferase/2-methoxy-6-polyprenyl-1,4-benzoquinol methylase
MTPAIQPDKKKPILPRKGLKNNPIQSMFGRIASHYDLLNHLLSFGLDFYWWRKMAQTAGARPGLRVLDVAAGTCDSTMALVKRGATVVACDFTMQMLLLGQKKFAGNSVLGAVGADARLLPFRDSAFDAVTICFGLRNVEQRAVAYAEFLRVLKSGGKLAVLEFSRPKWGWLRLLYGLYAQCILPALGGWVSGDKEAYKYLPESIRRFPSQAELAAELEEAGFDDVSWQNLSNGIVAVHSAVAP